jgi:CRISPR system Cascade subunit CasE
MTHLVRTRIDARALNLFAARTGTLDDDLGYALHLALRRRFGPVAPQPFRLAEPEAAHPHHPRLLGYVPDPAALEMPPTLPDPDGDWSDGADLAAIFPQPFEAKEMPADWPVGTRLRFEILLRPVRRHGPKARAARRDAGRTDGLDRPLRTGSAGRTGSLEFDAYELAVEALDRADPKPARSEIYASLLAERLDRAATVEAGSLALLRFRRSRVLRGAHSKAGGKSGAGRGGTGRGIEGPEALMSGRLAVSDGPAFADLVARGVGRHRAFGFGMLLLRPGGGG